MLDERFNSAKWRWLIMTKEGGSVKIVPKNGATKV